MPYDFQKAAVYEWEGKVVANTDTKLLPNIDTVQNIVDYVWNALNCANPPLVVSARKNAKACDATRERIRMRHDMLYSWIVLHELAHSWEDSAMITNDITENISHGSDWLARYIYLLARFSNLNLFMLEYTAREYKLKVNTPMLYGFINTLGLGK